MNRIITAVVSTLGTVAVATMAYAVATAGPASAATPVHAPHIVAQSSVPVLHAPISEFCKTPGTFALLEGNGWPVPLKCIRDAGGRDVWARQAGGKRLPAGYHWTRGHVSGCIVAWGGAGDTTAQICLNGRAFPS